MREFAASEVAGELEISTYAARALLADVLDVRHRLPRLWARVTACEVATWVARKVAVATRDLTPEQALFVDAGVAEYADGRLSWSRFETVLEARVVEADPEAAAAREAAAAAEQFAKVGRSNEHGQKTLYVRSTAAVITRIDATLDYLCQALRALGETENADELRVKAMLLLANPLQAVELLTAYKHANSRSRTAATRPTRAPPVRAPPAERSRPRLAPARPRCAGRRRTWLSPGLRCGCSGSRARHRSRRPDVSVVRSMIRTSRCRSTTSLLLLAMARSRIRRGSANTTCTRATTTPTTHPTPARGQLCPAPPAEQVQRGAARRHHRPAAHSRHRPVTRRRSPSRRGSGPPTCPHRPRAVDTWWGWTGPGCCPR